MDTELRFSLSDKQAFIETLLGKIALEEDPRERIIDAATLHRYLDSVFSDLKKQLEEPRA